MTLERLTQITSVGITSGITLNNPTLTGVTTIASLDSVSVGGTITAVDGNFSGNVTAVNGTFSGNVSVAGTITYEDVTNIDSVGLITARSGIHVTGGSVGIGTEYATRKLDVEIQTASGALGSVLNSHPIAEFINLSAGAPRGLEIGAPPDGFLSPVYLKVSGTSSRFAILDQSNDENFTILENGNVGIGTHNPTAKLHVSGGNIKVDNGYGIDFSATANSSGTMTSELLSDYEEGTWTPTLFSGATGGSYSTRNGGYVRVGNLVYASLDITGSGWTANGNHLKFGGLPFASAVVDNLTFGGAFVNYGNMIDQNTLSNCQFHISWNGSTTIDVYNNTAAVNGNTSGVSVNARIILSIVYRTS